MNKTEMILDFLAFTPPVFCRKKVINCNECCGERKKTQGRVKEKNRKNTG